MQYFKAVGLLIRPLNSIHPLALLYIGALITKAPTDLLIVALILYFVVHSAVTLSNDLHDSKVDEANGRDVTYINLVRHFGGSWLVILAYVGSLVASILYFSVTFTALLVVMIVFSWAYNAKPLQLSRRPIASILILGVCYGFAPFLAGISIQGTFSPELLLLGIGFALSRISLSILKDYKDTVGDAKHRKKTFLLVFGRTMVRRVSVATALLGYVATIISLTLRYPFDFNGSIGFILSVVIALWLVYEHTKLSPNKSYQQLNIQFHRLLSYELLFYGAVILWVSIS